MYNVYYVHNKWKYGFVSQIHYRFMYQHASIIVIALNWPTECELFSSCSYFFAVGVIVVSHHTRKKNIFAIISSESRSQWGTMMYRRIHIQFISMCYSKTSHLRKKSNWHHPFSRWHYPIHFPPYTNQPRRTSYSMFVLCEEKEIDDSEKNMWRFCQKLDTIWITIDNDRQIQTNTIGILHKLRPLQIFNETRDSRENWEFS